ncbi:MAG: NAD(+)/NADH kinase, partial [Pseudoflavonifractor sp.]
MAELEQTELALLAKLNQRNYTVESRMMLDVRALRDGKAVFEDLALNDAVITKGAVARIIDLSVYGDGRLISDFSGDGIIVCTPTGSTAYSMSAGGPIVEPTAENIIVTPICAHALHVRPMVLGQDRAVSAKMGKLTRKTAYLSVDGGKAVKLCGGDTVEIRKSQAKTLLVRLTGRSFYEIMNQKLGNG